MTTRKIIIIGFDSIYFTEEYTNNYNVCTKYEHWNETPNETNKNKYQGVAYTYMKIPA